MNNVNIEKFNSLKVSLKHSEKATIKSENACKYLSVLCRHFNRKVEAEWDEDNGFVYFPVGITNLTVPPSSEALHITCYALNEGDLDKQKAIINHHIALFARREKIKLAWG